MKADSASYGFLELAHEVLKASDRPLTHQEIWEVANATGAAKKLRSFGKTPWQSIAARLYVDIRDNPDSKFIKVNKPARFFLKARENEVTGDLDKRLDDGKDKRPSKAPPYKERDLHPLLAYFAFAHPTFNRGRSIYTKTIFHEKSQKGGYSEWIHPDMVGFYLPLDDWRPAVVEFNRILDNNSIRLFSFEIKRSLTKANYRESFFQAVSNSSWAHEGYLVAAEIVDDDDFRAELERLAVSFGIGIVHLDIRDVDASTVLFPARVRATLDRETVNKLCEHNPDFETFVNDVKIDFESKRLHRSEYDQIIKDPTQYALDKLGIK